MVFTEQSFVRGFEIGWVSDNAVEADGVEWLMTVTKAEFGDNFRVAGCNPEVTIEAADVGTSTRVKEGAKADSVGVGGEAKIPRDDGEAHVDIQRHGRGSASGGVR